MAVPAAEWDKLPSQIERAHLADIGFIVADWGGILFLLALDSAGSVFIACATTRRGHVLLKATMVISLVLIVGYVVAVWAMTGKPS